jgi:hypothetical protein
VTVGEQPVNLSPSGNGSLHGYVAPDSNLANLIFSVQDSGSIFVSAFYISEAGDQRIMPVSDPRLQEFTYELPLNQNKSTTEFHFSIHMWTPDNNEYTNDDGHDYTYTVLYWKRIKHRMRS